VWEGARSVENELSPKVQVAPMLLQDGGCCNAKWTAAVTTAEAGTVVAHEKVQVVPVHIEESIVSVTALESVLPPGPRARTT